MLLAVRCTMHCSVSLNVDIRWYQFKLFKTTFNTWKLRELDELEAMRRMTYKWNIICYVENLQKTTTTLNTWRWLRLTCLKKQQRFWMGKKNFTYATKAYKIASRTVILSLRPYAKVQWSWAHIIRFLQHRSKNFLGEFSRCL